jgi:hypothetical protein
MYPNTFALLTVIALAVLAGACSPKQTEPEASAHTQPPAQSAAEAPTPATAAATTPTTPTVTEPIASSVAPASKRPADATEFNGHWYKAVDNKISWHDAKKACEELDGYLACIETAKEQEFIVKLANGQYLYLGATDEAKEDTWVWLNGQAWEFTSWMEGQPNNYGGDEHYLATYDGGEWVDVAAEGSGFWMPTGYICEWDK